MIEDENNDLSSADFGVYNRYLKYFGGWKVVVIVNSAMMCYVAC
jgi:hypothetical protein